MTNPQSIESIEGTRERFNNSLRSFCLTGVVQTGLIMRQDRIKRLTTGSLPWFVFNKEEYRDIIKYLSVNWYTIDVTLGKLKLIGLLI